jgi:hypothetical protein
MKKFPELLVRLFPSDTLVKLKRLHTTYTGLLIRNGSKEYSIIEEIEHSIFTATLSNTPTPLDLNDVLNAALEESTYSNIGVYVKSKEWNPAQQSFKQFKIEHLDDGEPIIMHNENSPFCVKNFFLEMRV